MNIIDYIPHGRENRVSREYLVSLLGRYSPQRDVDRWIRKQIEEARKNDIIISTAKGYFQPYLPEEEDEIRKYVAREERRNRKVYESTSAARKYIKQRKRKDYEYCGSVIDGR